MATTDFLAIGDIVTEPFIKLKDARVSCAVNDEACTITMRWGDKIPYDSAVLCRAVGNSPNAAVSAARLGLKTVLVTDIGDDAIGKGNVEQLRKERIDTRYVRKHKGMPSNYHYVLSYESERTILVRHEEYAYRFPRITQTPRYVYLSSLAANSLAYHKEIEAWLLSHPHVFLTLQPGTFQMKMGVTELKGLYARANLLVVNKEEAARILGLPERGNEIKDLLTKMHIFGPRAVIITDGRAGAYSFDGNEMLHIPMYPDDRAPLERTGAGDAFASTVTAALALGVPYRDALLWAPINSMAVVQEIGAQKGLLTRKALEAFLKAAPASYSVTPL